MSFTPQTGETQVICIEKPSGFINWCIGVATFVMNGNPPADDSKPAPTELPTRPNRLAA